MYECVVPGSVFRKCPLRYNIQRRGVHLRDRPLLIFWVYFDDIGDMAIVASIGLKHCTDGRCVVDEEAVTLSVIVPRICIAPRGRNGVINKIECCSVDNLQSALSSIAAKMKSRIYQK